MRKAQKYWSGQPVPSAGDLPDPEIELGSPELQADSLPAELPGKPYFWVAYQNKLLDYSQNFSSDPLRFSDGVCVLSHAQLFATLWTGAHQAPLSIEFSRQ